MSSVSVCDILLVFVIRKYDISLYVESWGKPLDRLEPEWCISGSVSLGRRIRGRPI